MVKRLPGVFGGEGSISDQEGRQATWKNKRNLQAADKLQKQYRILTMEAFPYFHQCFNLHTMIWQDGEPKGTIIVPPSALSTSKTDTALPSASSEN